MKALLTARRVKRGREEEFRQKWVGGSSPDGMLAAYLLEDEEDPRETLSISFWDSAEKLLGYRTGEEAHKRGGELGGLTDKARWTRAFVAWSPLDIETASSKKKVLALPLLLLAAGAGAFYFLKKRKSGGEDDWEAWEPEPASTFQPGQPASAAASGPVNRAPGSIGTNPEPTTVREVRGHEHATRGEEVFLDGPRKDDDPHKMLDGGASGSRLLEGVGGLPPGQGTEAAVRSGGGVAQRSGGGRRVRDLMTPNPETVRMDTNAAEAAQLMKTLDVGVLPVVADGRLTAIITDRDLALGVATQGRRPREVRVGDLATAMPVTVEANTTVEEAARLMAEHQIRRLPVVEDATRLVGIISLGDLAAEGAEQAAGRALEEISEPAEPDR